jgi:hypothetical protein
VVRHQAPRENRELVTTRHLAKEFDERCRLNVVGEGVRTPAGTVVYVVHPTLGKHSQRPRHDLPQAYQYSGLA